MSQTQHDAVQHDTMQHDTMQRETVQRETVQHDALQREVAQAHDHPLRIGGNVMFTEASPRETFQCMFGGRYGRFTQTSLDRWRRDAPAYRKKFDEHPECFRIMHAPHTLYPWSSSEETQHNSIATMHYMSRIAVLLHFNGIVVHLPRNVAKRDDAARITRDLFAEVPAECTLYFENMASRPSAKVSEHDYYVSASGVTSGFDYFKSIFNERRVDARRWAFCLDTCHLFAHGTAMTTAEEAREMISAFSHLPIGVVHLNGSRHPRGSQQDKHATTMSSFDLIWHDDSSGLREILRWCSSQDIPIILERSGYTSSSQYAEEIGHLLALL